MKIIVTHKSCDLDGIASIWLLKKFLPSWHDAEAQFVPAGSKLAGNYEKEGNIIEYVDQNEVIHVDTGMGVLDHHQTQDDAVSAASLTLEYVKKTLVADTNGLHGAKLEAVERIIKIIVAHDHFKEVFLPNPTSDYYDTTLFGVLEGMQYELPGQDEKCVAFMIECLDALLHTFEYKISAEREIAEKGIPFETTWGKALGIETYNDTVLKLGQKMGYVIVVRKDPHSGSIRIKAIPSHPDEKVPIDLTPIHEEIIKIDPQANWFLHVSKRMLLNGSSKNPTMKGSALSLTQIMDLLKKMP